jgi:putative sigma-54 modulation protein
MKLQIEGHHLKITDAIQERVQEKVETLTKYFDGLHDVRVVLTVEDPRRSRVEILCGVIRGQQLVAKAEAEDLYAAVDDAVHKARELLKRYKDRLRSRKRGQNPHEVPEAPEVPEVPEP